MKERGKEKQERGGGAVAKGSGTEREGMRRRKIGGNRGWQRGGDQHGEIVCSFSIFSIARHP